MRLGDVVYINPESIRSEYLYDKIEYIDISSVGTGFLRGTTCLTLAEAPSRAKRIVKNGDTLLATVRPNLRSFFFVKNPQVNTIASTGFAVLRGGQKIDARFLYYTVTNQSFTDYLTANAKGAAYPAVDTEIIQRADIYLPPMPVQRKIATILSAYDDLIENNLRRIKILEQMAQGLYREWFIKFRFPGHEQVRMVDSPLGRIPEGWEVGRLDDAVVLQRGFDLPAKQRHAGNIPVFAATGITGMHDQAKVKGPGVITGRSGSLGMVIYVNEDFWPLNTTLWVKEFKRSTPLFAYFLLSGLNLGQFNSGAAVPTLNRNDVHGLPVILPTSAMLEKFDIYIRPINALINCLSRKNGNLRRTRDLLLPKLISGKLDVSELNINVGLPS